MCSVGDSFNIDITDAEKYCEYICKECGKEFKGISMGTIKCPSCHSTNTTIKN